MPPFINEDETAARIDDILDAVKTEADPDVLNAYRSLIRKRVPFFMRSYVAAYLVLQLEQKGDMKRSPGRSRKSGKSLIRRDRDESKKSDTQRIHIPEEESVKLFVSIGRNRRVFPRELLGMIMSESSAAREDVGVIRILDNYSFVQVRKEQADNIIEAINGKQFRGRTLVVNYARTRKDNNQEDDLAYEEGAE